MAVPSSGTLTMLGLAQEALYGTYGSGTITSPIHLYDLVNGGNSAGSGNSYPAINQNCTPNPADRSSLPLPYMWEEDAEISGPFTWYYNASIGNASNIAPGDSIYTDSALTNLITSTGVTGYQYWQDGANNTIPASQRHCGQGAFWYFYISATGSIESTGFACEGT